MKLKRLISALVVFTLVMTCAMSAVSAASFATTTTYSTDGEVQVKTEINAGLEEGTMVSYIIYDDSVANVPNEDNIKYINQSAVKSGKVSFSVTDTIAKLDGKKILMGASAGEVTPVVPNDDVVVENSGSLLVTVDDIVDKTETSATFLVSQFGSTAQTGINVYATLDNGEEYVFEGLMNLSDSNYYAIELVDDSAAGVLKNVESYRAVPVVDGVEMVQIGETGYWVVADAE